MPAGTNLRPTTPRVGISSCLLGQPVRYNGRHKHDASLTQALGPFVEWVPVCPEVEVGMGVPREPIRLVGSVERPRLVGEQSGRDWTEPMTRYAEARVRQLLAMRLDGCILKAHSPSCGPAGVPVETGSGPARAGRGLFAATLLRLAPTLPVEDEARLGDPAARERFIGRVVALHDARQ
jgi:uncharacterized protein YbbK (DUF523 family)